VVVSKCGGVAACRRHAMEEGAARRAVAALRVSREMGCGVEEDKGSLRKENAVGRILYLQCVLVSHHVPLLNTRETLKNLPCVH
jgi:hypothetical protein